MLLPNPRGNFSFIEGISPYSGGVVASPGYSIEHVRLLRPIPWREGFQRIDAHLQQVKRPRHALCAIALRSPKPFSFGGFNQFNVDYVEMLKSWNLHVDGRNPVARTNVAPAYDPPAEPSLFSFAITQATPAKSPTFVVAGGGELPEGSLDPHDVIRKGEVSSDALAEKTRFVLGLMEGRLHAMGAGWEHVTVTNIYTVHDLNGLLAKVILPRLGKASQHGVVWNYTRPPIESIEYEMDLRCAAHETLLAP